MGDTMDEMEELLKAADKPEWKTSPEIIIQERPKEFHIEVDLPFAEHEDIRVGVSPWRVVIACLPPVEYETVETEVEIEVDAAPLERQRDARGRFVKASPVKVTKKIKTMRTVPKTRKVPDGYRDFERAIPMPCEVVPEGAEARINNGVLEVIAPKVKLGGEGVYRLHAQ